MKYLLLAVVIFAAYSFWKRSRTAPVPPRQKEAASAAGPQQMLACLHCGIHTPEPDVLWGVRGAYCSDAHRRLAGDQPKR